MADPPLILVVDDEQSYRDALSIALQREGFLVETAADGPEAIAQTKALTLKAAFGDISEQEFAALIESHAGKRQSAEAAEGLASFAEKRAAKWTPKKD